MDKVPSYKHLSFELSKMRMCVCMSNHISSCIWRARSCVSIHYRWLCFCVLYSTVEQFFNFKPRMSGSKRVIEFNPTSYQNLCHQRQVWMTSQLALFLLLLTTLQLYHHPPPLPPPVSNSSCLFTRCQPLLLYCIPVLLKVLYCKILNGLFFVLFLNVLFGWKVL